MRFDARKEAPDMGRIYKRGGSNMYGCQGKVFPGTRVKVRNLGHFQNRMKPVPIHTPTPPFLGHTPERKMTRKVDHCEQQRSLRVRGTMKKSVPELIQCKWDVYATGRTMILPVPRGPLWPLVSRCHHTASNEVEGPVITWVQALGSYLEYLEGVS